MKTNGTRQQTSDISGTLRSWTTETKNWKRELYAQGSEQTVKPNSAWFIMTFSPFDGS